MATHLKNLSEFIPEHLPDCSGFRFGVVVSEWNDTVTFSLLDGVRETLLAGKVNADSIIIDKVPGTFELPLAAQWLAEKDNIDAVICLGCVIQGETRHFDFICDAAAQGVMNVSLKTGKPVIFGVLTTNDLEQAMDRSGGKHGNKGVEAAVTAMKMLEIRNK